MFYSVRKQPEHHYNALESTIHTLTSGQQLLQTKTTCFFFRKCTNLVSFAWSNLRLLIILSLRSSWKTLCKADLIKGVVSWVFNNQERICGSLQQLWAESWQTHTHTCTRTRTLTRTHTHTLTHTHAHTRTHTLTHTLTLTHTHTHSHTHRHTHTHTLTHTHTHTHTHTRGWHGSEFSNLSHPTPTKMYLFPSQSHDKTGRKSRPVHSRKNDSHSLPLPCCCFFFFTEICQLQ